MTQVYSLACNSCTLDGGAMFGNAPRPVWERWLPVDERHRVRLATRSLLLKTAGENILFEAGVGSFMQPDLRDRFGIQEPENLLIHSLAEKGITPDRVTRIFLSHLHFDHVGGLLADWRAGQPPELAFPNARVYITRPAWERAVNPNPRDRASFIPELPGLLEQYHRLELLEGTETFRFDGISLTFVMSTGHTPGLACADLRMGQERLVVTSDLVPGKAWLRLPITSGFDRFPEKVVEEKKLLLDSIARDKGWVFFFHDPHAAACRLDMDEKGIIHPLDCRESLEFKI